MQHPYGALTRNFRLIRLKKFRGQQPAGPTGDGETWVVSVEYLMILNGHLMRSGGINPSCFFFTRFTVLTWPCSQFENYQVIPYCSKKERKIKLLRKVGLDTNIWLLNANNEGADKPTHLQSLIWVNDTCIIFVWTFLTNKYCLSVNTRWIQLCVLKFDTTSWYIYYTSKVLDYQIGRLVFSIWQKLRRLFQYVSLNLF